MRAVDLVYKPMVSRMTQCEVVIVFERERYVRASPH